MTARPLAHALFGRPVVLSVAIAALLATMGWWAGVTADGQIGASSTLHAPVGTEVVLSLLTVRRIEGPDAYVLGNATFEIPVLGPTAGLTVGEDVTVGGTVGPGHVRARWLEHAPDRQAKKRLGILGLAAAAGLAVTSLRPAPGGLAIRPLRT